MLFCVIASIESCCVVVRLKHNHHYVSRRPFPIFSGRSKTNAPRFAGRCWGHIHFEILFGGNINMKSKRIVHLLLTLVLMLAVGPEI